MTLQVIDDEVDAVFESKKKKKKKTKEVSPLTPERLQHTIVQRDACDGTYIATFTVWGLDSV